MVMVLVLTTGLVFVSQTSRELYGDGALVQERNKHLQAELAREKLRQSILAQRYFDYSQSVAAVLGEKAAELNDWQELSLLQVSRLPASADKESLTSATLLTKGKEQFRKDQFNEAIHTFMEIEIKFPGSVGSLEARFLRAESHYALGQLDQCLDVIDDMMTFYPEHPMTGYLMLRFSQILQYRKRTAEALDVLSMVKKNFAKEPEIRRQAALMEGQFRSL